MSEAQLDVPLSDGEHNQEREFWYRRIIRHFPELADHPDALYGDNKLTYYRLINEGLIAEVPDYDPQSLDDFVETSVGKSTYAERVRLLEKRDEMAPGQKNDAEIAHAFSTPGNLSNTALNSQIDSPRTYTTSQTFDTGEGAPITIEPNAPMEWNTRTKIMNIGPDLELRRHQGNAGQRLALTGRDSETMPYFEVVASTRTGTDGGAAVAGYQLHLGPDDGAGNNREMFVIEAVGERHSDGPHFRIATHASGTGVRRPLIIKGGDATAFKFDNTGSITAYMPIKFGGDNSILVSGYRNDGNQTAVQSIAYSNSSAVADVFLGVAGGRNDAPTPPPAGRVLGSYKFGSHNGTTRVDAAQIRAVATESWTFGSAEGNRMEFLIKKNGSAASTIAARVADPAWNQAGLSILANTDGGSTATLKQVFIGPVNSAGDGYRTLRIAN